MNNIFRLQTIQRGISPLLMVAWPCIIWLVMTHPAWRWLLPLATVLFLLRLVALTGRSGLFSHVGKGLAVVGMLLSLASLLLSNHHLLLWYPVVVSVVMLLLFAGSLFTAMPMVERLARLREPELPPDGVVWTRQVTRFWCLFFIFNGGVAMATCLVNNLLWWTWWNGLISYLLMGLLLMGAWPLRQRKRARA